MKKALTVLLAMAITTACKAEDSKQVTELKKRCEELSKETGETYLYGSGELKYFMRSEPPAHAPIMRDNPNIYNADFIMLDQKQQRIAIRGTWKNPDAPLGELELAPLPMAMDIGKKYHFCYKIIKRNLEESFYIHYPETIQLLKE